jgi:release factor glutamine methyltransferase
LISQQKEPLQKWTVVGLINWTTDYLIDKSMENSRLIVERLLAHTLQVDRVHLYLNFDRPLDAEELSVFKAKLKRRLNHEPLQYIIGEAEFMSLPFRVSPGVLIPRPETEVLVEACIKLCRQEFGQAERIDILDIGTGSGNIAIALAKNLKSAFVTAIDSSAEALKVARENALLNDVSDKIEFVHSPIEEFSIAQYDNGFDMVVSNPPYVSASEYAALPPEIRDYEPEEALLAGEEGLDFYRKNSVILRHLLRPHGFAILEIGAHQGESVRALFVKEEVTQCEILKDLAGRDRVILLKQRRTDE